MNSLITFNSADVNGSTICILDRTTKHTFTVLSEYNPCYLGNKQWITQVKLTLPGLAFYGHGKIKWVHRDQHFADMPITWFT
jgi:hypothetical protein